MNFAKHFFFLANSFSLIDYLWVGTYLSVAAYVYLPGTNTQEQNSFTIWTPDVLINLIFRLFILDQVLLKFDIN